MRFPAKKRAREFYTQELRESRDSPDGGKQRRILSFSGAPREFRDFRDSSKSSSEGTPFVMTPSSVPEEGFLEGALQGFSAGTEVLRRVLRHHT